jgi:hypothetical protein
MRIRRRSACISRYVRSAKTGSHWGSGSGSPPGQAAMNCCGDHSWVGTSCPRPAWLCVGRQLWKPCCPKACHSIRIGC